MDEMKKAIKEQHLKEFEKDLIKCKTKEGFKECLKWNRKTYIGTEEQQKKKLLRYLNNKTQKRIKEELNKIDQVNNSNDFEGDFIITIEWKKSHMWGMNPKAYTNYGFEGSSIGGCGYDKLSTAVAEALNSHIPILKLMYQMKNEELKNKKPIYKEQNGFETTSQRGINQFLFGYGSGYGLIPRFEGGVGVSSHQSIIEKIGLKWRNISSTKTTDVYLISKKVE